MLQSLATGLRRSKKLLTEEADPAPVQSDPDLDPRNIVIGISGHYSKAGDITGSKGLLKKGLDVVEPVPADRFDREAPCDPEPTIAAGSGSRNRWYEFRRSGPAACFSFITCISGKEDSDSDVSDDSQSGTSKNTGTACIMLMIC